MTHCIYALGDEGVTVRVHLLCHRRLLFLAPENFVSQPAGVGDILPFSYTLNFLFSQAPPELKSPHQVGRKSNKN